MEGVSEVQSLGVNELIFGRRLSVLHQFDARKNSQESQKDKEEALMNSKGKRGIKLNVCRGIRQG